MLKKIIFKKYAANNWLFDSLAIFFCLSYIYLAINSDLSPVTHCIFISIFAAFLLKITLYYYKRKNLLNKIKKTELIAPNNLKDIDFYKELGLRLFSKNGVVGIKEKLFPAQAIKKDAIDKNNGYILVLKIKCDHWNWKGINYKVYYLIFYLDDKTSFEFACLTTTSWQGWNEKKLYFDAFAELGKHLASRLNLKYKVVTND